MPYAVLPITVPRSATTVGSTNKVLFFMAKTSAAPVCIGGAGDARRENIGALGASRALVSSGGPQVSTRRAVGQEADLIAADPADDIYATFEDLSRHVAGHSHSDAHERQPEPADLKRMIDRVQSLVGRARSQKRAPK
jgi:hypothetical protein